MKAASLLMSLAVATTADADFVAYDDFDEWQAALGETFHTVTFTELGGFQILDDQYVDRGILFPEGNDHIDDSSAFQNDLWGVDGFDATITVDFTEDVYFVGVHFPGDVRLRPYRDGEMLADIFLPAGFAFGGVIADEPFDRVIFLDPFGDVNIDDLHIPIIPSGPTWAVVASMVVIGRRRRV